MSEPRLAGHEHRPIMRRPHFGLGAGMILLVLFVVLTIGVGPQAGRVAPATAFPPIGRLDQATYDVVQHVNQGALTPLAKVLNFLGGGWFNIPFRTAAVILLLFLRRFRHAVAFALIWLVSEVTLNLVKALVDRARPPDPLILTRGASYPSGHSVAGAAIGIALVVSFISAGHRRRAWEWAAGAFAFLMGLSRVYLNAHWLSDAVGGVVLGAGVALAIAGAVALADRRIVGHVPADEIESAELDAAATPAVPPSSDP
jgi:membrane-associated phospholipid phosphatase